MNKELKCGCGGDMVVEMNRNPLARFNAEYTIIECTHCHIKLLLNGHCKAEVIEAFKKATRADVKQGICKWHKDDSDSNSYATDCGRLFEFNEGGCKDNNFKYCYFCGKEISEINLPESE